jgi:hypothetical protein
MVRSGILRGGILRGRTLLGLKVAALAAVISLACGSPAWAHDDDDDDYSRRDNAIQYGYQNGYRAGVRHANYDRSQGYRYNYKSEQWEEARDGYTRWMGSFGQYRRGFRQGYENGYRAGYSSGWRRGDIYRDDGYYDRSGRGYYGGGGERNVAYDNGWNDGSSVAQSDLAGGKNYNSSPRGRYDDADHGYRREFGDKRAYQSEYTAGYRAGYDSVFGQARSRW